MPPLAVGAIVIFGRLLLRPLFRLVAAAGASELFVAATLFVIVGTGVAAAVAGLSMALGAFVAGLLLAETEFRKAIETTIEPFKGLLLGFFFFTVGMNIDVRELAREPFWLLASVVGLIGIKAILLTGLARLFRLPGPRRSKPACCSAPAASSPSSASAWPPRSAWSSADVSSFTLAVTSITMALIPVLALVARRLAPKFREPKALDPELAIAPERRHRTRHRHRARPGRRGRLRLAGAGTASAYHRRRQRRRCGPGTSQAAAARSITATPPTRTF